jgi:acyl-CoA hydrolase
LPSTGLDDISRRIAAHAASLIDDGSTLQFGVGRIPDAILSSLSPARNLGIHSGLINDAVVDLIEQGAVTNAGKGIDAGVTVTNQVIGTQRLSIASCTRTRPFRCGRRLTHITRACWRESTGWWRSTPRADIDAVVTEWSIAELRGCTLKERARRMIEIAAPEHREALSRA